MIKKLLPLVFLCVGLAAGVGAGFALAPTGKPQGEKEAKAEKPAKAKSKTDKKKGDKDEKAQEYLKLTKQFVVPVVTDDEIAALVTMSLSLEAKPGLSDSFYEVEPKLRDAFLQVLFDHANSGGFDGTFTASGNLKVLRRSLLDVAQKELGEDVSRVLIMSVNRQDS